jgi:hypothetical protein
VAAFCPEVLVAQGYAPREQPAAAPSRSVSAGNGAFAYAKDYPFIDYQSAPAHNEIARLEQRLARGEVKLEYREPRGYLDSLLAALSIDPASQSVVFSKTSLQVDLISAETPRALYFNDETYVGWVPHSGIIEITTMDSQLGAVFYTLPQTHESALRFQHETSLCLTCHDTYSMGGGGVPSFLFLSAYTRAQNEIFTHTIAEATGDTTPLEDRWGGWYVTGQMGHTRHLGDLLPSPIGWIPAAAVRPQELAHLGGLFDTGSYLTDTSDAVALLVFSHEVYLHNLLIRANLKSRMLMELQQRGSGSAGLTWDQMSPATQQRMRGLLEPLVRALLFSGAAPLPEPVHGAAAFQRGFVARGPRDAQGRSLRDLDLNTRLFKHPLSFLIYSDGFDGMPAAVKAYVYQRLAEILSGADQSPAFAHLSCEDRQAILEILRATKRDFARTVVQAVHPAEGTGLTRPGA